jgi:hypothetical protein
VSVAPTITRIIAVALEADQVTFTELGGSTYVYTDFHRGFLIWSRKSLIVSVAPTTTRIVAVALEVDQVTFTKLGGLTCV